MINYHLAQINIAKMLAPLDDPIMKGFVERLDEINALADGAEGFVWRLTTDDGNATSIQAYEDNMMIINMSVWVSMEALYQYTYYSKHAEVFRQRKDWFSKMERPHIVLWWIPAGTTPTVVDGAERLAYLQKHDVSPYAFTFKQSFSVDDYVATLPQTKSAGS